MADGLTIQITGIDGTIRRLSPEEAVMGLREGMQRAVLRGHRKLSENLSGKILKVRQGILRGAISTEIQATQNEVIGILTNLRRWRWKGREGSLLAVHEFGATIVPRDPAGYLVFKIGDQWIRTKKVVIPAREPMKTTLKEIKSDVIKDIQTALVNRLNGQKTGFGLGPIGVR